MFNGFGSRGWLVGGTSRGWWSTDGWGEGFWGGGSGGSGVKGMVKGEGSRGGEVWSKGFGFKVPFDRPVAKTLASSSQT